jgi:site-specific recombinase XerD
MLSRLGKHLSDDCTIHPQKLLHVVTDDAPLARALEDYFTSNQLALPTDRDDVHAAARRHSRVAAVPEPLRKPAADFVEHLLAGRGRARRARTRPRGHATIEARLTAVRDLAIFLVNDRGKSDWATTDVGDIEAFLAGRPTRRAWYLTGLRQFFGYCLRTRLILIDPTTGVQAPQSMTFHGKTVPADRQKELFVRWTTDPDVHPHEAFVGLAALLHAMTTSELQHLTDAHIDHSARTIRLDHRRHPTPLDPFTWQALQACLSHRQQVGSANRHVLITTRTKATRDAASDGYIKNTLRAVGIRPRILRSTRLVDLVASLDAKLVADAYGMTNEAVIAYLADHVDPTRLPNP